MRAAIRAAMARDWIVHPAGRGRSRGLDETLDRQVAAALEYQRLMRLPSVETMTPDRARAFSESQLGLAELDAQPMARIIDTTVGDPRVPVRVYVPPGASAHWLVWCHGGGGVI